MEPLTLTPAEIAAGLSAMKTIALADGALHDGERDLIAAAARALGADGEVDAVAPIAPEALAAALPDARTRERALQAMLLVALMDGEASDAEVACIERFARALSVDEPRVEALRLLAAGRVRLMWLHLARRSFGRRELEEALRDEGVRGLWRVIGPMIGMAKDYELARRYNDLGALPQGTFGRAYWEFITSSGLGFPGEANAVPERGVWHDLSHVLSGYGTDPDGEVQVVSFIAGYRREDPFFWLFTIALQFHLGLKVSPYSPAGITGRFDPDKVLRALQRGMAMNVDLSDRWDYRPLLPLPLEEVRRMCNVPPP
jgi:uncharacterized tellurite resistance protein B-like protein